MSNISLGTARLDLTVNTDSFQASVERAKTLASSFSGETQKSFQKAGDQAKTAAKSVQAFIERLGMSAEQQRLFNLQMKGVPLDVVTELAKRWQVAKDRIEDAAEIQARAAEKLRMAADFELFKNQAADAQRAFRLAESVEVLRGELERLEAQERRQASQDAFVQSVNRRINALGKLQSELLEMEAIENGTIDRLRPQIAALRAHEKAIRDGSQAVEGYGRSAKQMQAAMRNMPAQITDIVVSLQVGQNPLQVLLQQGGQIYDMFGGLRPAAQAFGSTLSTMARNAVSAGGAMALIGAAALGTFVAWRQGVNDVRVLNEAMILTGRASQYTKAEMLAMAEAIDEASNTTTGAAAEMLAEIVRGGKLTVEQSKIAADATLRMRDAFGDSAGDTAKLFIAIREGGTEAALEINKVTGFLSESTLKQAQALEKQGRTAEAVNLLINELYGDLTTKSAKALTELDAFSRDWHEVKVAAREFWDDCKAGFREWYSEMSGGMGLVDKFRQKWDDAKSSMEGFRNLLTGGPAGMFGFMQGTVAPAPAPKAAPPQEKKPPPELLANQEAFRRRGQRYETPKERNDREMQEELAAAKKAGYDENSKQWLERKKAIEAAQARKAPKPTKPDQPNDRESGEALLRRMKQEIELGKEQASTTDTLTKADRFRAEARTLLADKTAKVSAETRKELQVAQERLDQQEREARSAAVKEKLEAMQFEIDLIGKSAQEQARLIAIREAGAKVTAKEARELGDKAAAQVRAQEAEGVRRTIDDMQFEISLIGKSNAEKARMIALRQSNGTATKEELEAIGKLTDEMERMKYVEEAQAAITGGMSDMFSSIIDGSKSASEAFEDFADHIIKTAARLLAEQAVLWMMQSFFPATNASAGSTGGFSQPTLAAAKGAYFDGSNANFFAKGGTFTNSIVSKPTGFLFGKGGKFGVMGEAGPEAVMPLQRDSSGRLGVRADGIGGGGSNVQVFVENKSGGEARTESGENPDGSKFIKVIIEQAVAEVDRRIGSMGSTGRMIGSRFGMSPVGVSRG